MTLRNLQIAIQYHQQGELEPAEKIYREILAAQPEYADVWHLLGILQAQRQQYVEAKTAINKAIAIDPANPTYENSLGNVYKNLKLLDAALSHYQKALKLKPNYAVAFNNIGAIYSQQTKFIEAEKYFRQAIQAQPDYADAQYNLGNLLGKQQQFVEAMQHYQEAIRLNPDHPRGHAELGQLLQQQERTDEAIRHYQEALKLDPENVLVEHNLGTALVKQGDYKGAIEHFLKTIQLEPKHTEALHNLGSTYLLLNKPQDALKYFLQLLQYAKDADTYYNIGAIFAQLDRHKDALDFLNQAEKLNPNHLDTQLNLGATYLKMDDYQNAVIHYQQALRIDPKNKEVDFLLNALEKKQAPNAAPKEYLQHLFDQYAPYFDKHLAFLEYQVPELLYQAVYKELKGKKDLTILDLGCGTGLAGEKFKQLAQHLIGIDIAEKMVAAAKEKEVYDNLKVMDVTAALTEFTGMDLIVAADVFTYIGDLAAIFSKTYAALNKMGLFAFTTEKTDSYPYLLQQSARYAHNKKYLEELAGINNFKIRRCDEVILRKQKNQPVNGYLYILEKS